MKKALWVVVAVAMLAGCGAIPTMSQETTATQTVHTEKPEESNTLIPAASLVLMPSPTPSPFVSASVLEEETPAPAPTPEFTNTPYQDAPKISSVFPPVMSKKVNQGFSIGTVSVETENYVYCTQLNNETYEGSSIFALNRKTGKVIKLRDAETVITQIFLDSNRSLYYVSYKKDQEWNSMLYQYSKSGDILIADSIGMVVRVDLDNIYYTTDYYITNQDGTTNIDMTWTLIGKYSIKEKVTRRIAAIEGSIWPAWFPDQRPLVYFVSNNDSKTYVMNLEDGKIYKVSERDENYLESSDGTYLIKYENVNDKTKFTLYNYKTLKMTTCLSPINATKFYYPYIVNNRLFIITDNEKEGSYDITKSTIFEIDLDSGVLHSKTNLDYVSDACVYQGKWYLYTLKLKYDSENVSHMIGQKVRAFDPATHRYSVIESLGNRTIGDDKEFLFEVCGGYVWMIQISGCEGASYGWWKRFPIRA